MNPVRSIVFVAYKSADAVLLWEKNTISCIISMTDTMKRTALESLVLQGCKSLTSLPSGPEAQEYSSLRRLVIRECPGIKSLPSALQQRLDSGFENTYLDSRLEGTHQSFPYGACINLVFACRPCPFFVWWTRRHIYMFALSFEISALTMSRC